MRHLFAQEYKIGAHDLFIMPTAYTIPKDSFYFSSYELLFMAFSYSPTNSTQLVIFSFFPINTTAVSNTFTLGFKQNIYKHDIFANSLLGNYNIKNSFYSIGNVSTYRAIPEKLNFSFSLMYSKNGSNEEDFSNFNEFFYMLGTEYILKNNDSFVLEYINIFKAFKEDKLSGLLTFGYRLRTSRIAWDFGGFRPFRMSSNLIAFPFIKATIIF